MTEERRFFWPTRINDLRSSILPFIGTWVTVGSWHSNWAMKEKYPEDDSVGHIEEFGLDIPESELLSKFKPLSEAHIAVKWMRGLECMAIEVLTFGGTKHDSEYGERLLELLDCIDADRIGFCPKCDDPRDLTEDLVCPNCGGKIEQHEE